MKKVFKMLIFFSFLSIQMVYAKVPKNIIILISDGCGFNHVKAADYYQYGRKGRQPYEHFKVACAMSTYSIPGDYDPHKAWHKFDYLIKKYTDSAAAVTAMGTGHKTYNGMLGVDKNSNILKNVVDFAEENKKSTGVISSVYISHATPAGFVAHNPDRHDYQEIAREMIMDSKVEVIMGCGHPQYNDNGQKITGKEEKFDYQNKENDEDKIEYKYVGGRIVWQNLLQSQIGNDADYDGQVENWHLIQTKSDFQELANGETPERVLGIPRVRSTLQYERNGEEKKPFEVAFNENIPTLSEMTAAGLNVLDNNDNGFFVMIEGGAVDWASHDNNSSRMIEEQIAFNQTVETVVNWVENKSNWNETLVIITADHECGYLFGPGSGGVRNNNRPIDSVWKPIKNRGKGELPAMQWYHDSHSNLLVPFYAKGPGSKIFLEYADEEDLKYGRYLDNTEVGRILIDMVK